MQGRQGGCSCPPPPPALARTQLALACSHRRPKLPPAPRHARSNPPLIVRGPGAGPAVTAAGVFGDLITLAKYLGAPS